MESIQRIGLALVIAGAIGWGSGVATSTLCDAGACMAAAWTPFDSHVAQSTARTDARFLQEVAETTGMYLFFGAIAALLILEIAKPHLARAAARHRRRQ